MEETFKSVEVKDSTMDENPTKPFFSQLQSLSRHINKQITHLKEELKTPAGQKPQHYDRGLSVLKKDSQDLKKLSQELGKKLTAVTNFSSYLESVQELVNQQSTDIDKMERYLMRFGYVPPQPKVTVKKADDEKENVPENKEETSVRCSEEASTTLTLHKSPILSEVGLQVLQGKDLPLMTPAKQKSTAVYSNYLKTPTASNTQSLQSSDVTSSSVSTSRLPWSKLTVDQWLTEAKENIELTPDVLHVHKKLPVREKLVSTQYESALDMRESKQRTEDKKDQLCLTPCTGPSTDNQAFEDRPSHPPVNNAPNWPPNGYASPSEPEFSDYTKQLLTMTLPKQENVLNNLMNISPMKKYIKSATPEEPDLLLFGSSNSHKIIMSGKDCTPEEPVFSYQEYMSSSASASNVDNKTPEEPVLSYQHENTTSHRDNWTPEEPVLSTAYKGPVENVATSLETPHRNQSEDPLSPELSEVTQSLLSLTSLSHKTQSYQPRRNLYTNRNIHDHLKNKQSFSSLHSNKNSKYILSENFPESRYIPQQSKKFEFHSEVNQSGKKSWRHPGVTMEDFIGTDNIPLSPQLSDVTQKVIGQVKRW